MSWIATAIAVGGSYLSSREAGKSAERAADTSADAQLQGLEYLKDSERLPMFYRDQALGLLAQEFGLSPYVDDEAALPVLGYSESKVRNPEYDRLARELEGKTGRARWSISRDLKNTPEFITEETPIYGEVTEGGAVGGGIADIARRSPLYDAIMSTREAGEESLARNLAATGGLRGGRSISDLARYNTDLENRALLSSYQNVMGGLSSLAGQQGYAPQIAQQYSNIGETRAAGILGQSQATQDLYGGVAGAIGQGFKAYYDGKV
ncbi:MAG: hypothetical protein ACN2B6_00930 [Rickettsiales bacterium]